MKPKDLERLARNRGVLMQTVDVMQIIPYMRQEGALSHKDEEEILQDPRRRQRTAKLLDMLEHKKTDVYVTFLDALEDHYPHLFLQLRDWEDDPDELFEDEWTILRQSRKYLIKEIDGRTIVDELCEKGVLNDEEKALVIESGGAERCTECLLDIMETKSGNAYELFLEAVNTIYPHVYLLLTDMDDDLDDL